jgi:hypothetical protein
VSIRPEYSDGLEKLPRLITMADEVLIVGEAIKQIQVELFRLEVNQRMNGHSDADLMPGSERTYVQEQDVYNIALQRLMLAYPDVISNLEDSAKGV